MYLYETTFPWEADAHVFEGSEMFTLGQTTELVAIRNDNFEPETTSRFEFLIIRRADGRAFAWEVTHDETCETIAIGEADTEAEAKVAAEQSARHAAERLAGGRVFDSTDGMLDKIVKAAAAIRKRREQE
ncbi:hypothetical protein G6K98_15985 [Agrobacterium rhizogenes]|nr:hypothetical protein [Rhizobium rhizogenes]NTH59495.1 hypothetical protein [Rhizobium rhizogenes]NTH90646.1 hypothetical protein [Rhizobium rhizogenes]